jgi:response regulator NasT
VVDHSDVDLPAGILLETRLGRREINEVWLFLEESQTQAAQPQAGSRPPLRILVADDDRDTRAYLQEMIARLGHQVFAVETGRQLVELCRATQPDLVVTDIRLPEGEGIDAAIEVYRERPVPFILVSGYHDPQTLARAAAEPIMAYLIKPVQEAELATAIRVAMSRFEQQRLLSREVMDLQHGLEERKLLERAKGIVMRRLHVDEVTAYQRLRKVSSDCNRKLVEVARDILQAEEIFALLEGLGERESRGRAAPAPALSGRSLPGMKRG